MTTTSGAAPRHAPSRSDAVRVVDPLTDRDFQLALWMLYELHYRGFDDVDPELEWDPLMISSRSMLEGLFERAVRTFVGLHPGHALDGSTDGPATSAAVVDELVAMTSSDVISDLASFLQRKASEDQFRHYLAQRAVYHLRESDPQSFVLPRLDGAAKAALAGLQFDEYGAGRADRLHATLYATALESLGMSSDVAAYVDDVDATALASVNLMSLFALNRRLRGAALGHLAAFEATSSVPCRMIAQGARRLGLPEAVADYYDEHVEADSVHEQVAIREICGSLVADDAGLATDVLFGAAACLAVDGLAGDVLLRRWREQPAAVEAAS
ncbi:hypothetical protein HNR19_000556 [Nocardioides thalensis]|uniref:Iron-containing redox enzyme family protein n=1 Tax=Nocardioides thalensis TaxID=1914755 RepID=A0A853BZS1_9ACTN|nr:iron-containing redox enzyme family protein [Nocardioides thalensis]NYI99857.1 hypothetical protein [Nocardioides thalensis]